MLPDGGEGNGNKGFPIQKPLCKPEGNVSVNNSINATLVGEEGINLSGGQKQLIAMARALYKKPKLLLLDEPTSSMDRNTESFIIKLIQSLREEMGVLIITHRNNLARLGDRIYIMENGSVAFHGTPGELLLTDNLYSRSVT